MAELGETVLDTTPAKPVDAECMRGRHATLRRLQDSDFASLWESVGAHDSVFTYWPAGPYKEPGEFTDAVKGIFVEEPDLVIYAVLLRDEAVGLLFLLPTSLPKRVMEIGALYGPALQKTRAATEAVYLGACLAFDTLNNRRLAWKTSHTNLPSQRAAQRWGFTFEGRLRQDGIQQGRNRDTMWYSMLDGEWPVCKRAFEAWLSDDNFDGKGQQRRSLGEIRRACYTL